MKLKAYKSATQRKHHSITAVGYIKKISITFLLFALISGCTKKQKVPALFKVMDNKETGIDFANKLHPEKDFNVFDYMYFYNGAGVGVGDFNNDGLTDIFFAANQSDNKIYLNTGGLHFKDVTQQTGMPQDGGWSTGVSVADVNDDGLLDIYVCRVGKMKTLNSHNLLLICTGIDKNGVPHYKDESAEYGVDFSGFSTQAAFFDYDHDGDLDMYLLNHSVHQNGTYGERSALIKTTSPVSGDRMYRNDGGHFTDVTKVCGINSSILGYGLGICVSDINLDGWPDIYIGNDFHENDYLYINQHNGSFKEESADHLMHTSRYTMGVDIADATNDGFPEIISMDMLSNDPYILKRSENEDDYDVYNLRLEYGYNYQYSRNNLQYNRRNGMFSEAGLYAGVAATDWSWSALWMDFDNDGLKDLFISNGIPKRLNDLDFLNYLGNDEVQMKLRMNNLDENDMQMIDKFPQIKIPSKFYKNDGDLKFEDIGENIQGRRATFANGAAYADFDNDGDLDIIVNNIDEPAVLYKNKANDKKTKPAMQIKLEGFKGNRNAVGSKIICFEKNDIRTYENFTVHGFLSSMQTPFEISSGKTKPDSIVVVWPDNTYEKVNDTSLAVTLKYREGLPTFNYNSILNEWPQQTKQAEDITKATGIAYRHYENRFTEFDREPLLPHMLSTEGPALAVADVNHDGLDDVFIGSSKSYKSVFYLQQANGKFKEVHQQAIDNDSMYEDVDGCFADVNNDGNIDLIVASGGNEYFGTDEHLLPRVYLNDGKANFKKKDDAFANINVTQSCVVPYDFNGDGFVDLFIGGRAVPWNYGEVPRSYLLQNDGTGKFKDVTLQNAKDLSNAGFITQALWYDIDNDGDKDLLLAMEWGSITAFINNKGTFTKKVLSPEKGWWNFILPVDVNNDGKIDLIAGNLGLNSRLKASLQQPVKMFYDDFDNNGKKEQLLTYYLHDKELSFADKGELEKQMPALKKKFLYAEDFAKAKLDEIFPENKRSKAALFTADYFSNAILINQGNLKFKMQALPWQAQLSSYRNAAIINANNDSFPDILLTGNFYDNNVQMGRYDADYGTVLLNNGSGNFTVENLNSLQIKGQARHIKKLSIQNTNAYIIARNSDSAMIIKFK